MSIDFIITHPHKFKVTPYGSARKEIRDNYEKRVGTEAEEIYLVSAFLSCMVEYDQREAFALLKDEVRGEIAKEWFLLSKNFYNAIGNGEEPNLVY